MYTFQSYLNNPETYL